ncbi:hypothetical protein PISMIDRAFT_464067 [Pisolithus microcarpus 441]|uniref:Uncharacterized protein n=1 Tax=Pisolithus microcarpus 441 TaxID=765257 RepID=A0A0C9XIH4_9AGAM|nr:hypothetical protein BKA83DRAFT_464067 [Pisolithus microcarpus]KIK12110.1 hypothetical protein PISMIDRAFT_464067 [Pisolithus microcarpus 441]
MVDNRISLITRKLSSIEDITRIKPCRYNLYGKKDRGKQEETYSVEIDTKSAEQPVSSVGFTQLFRCVSNNISAIRIIRVVVMLRPSSCSWMPWRCWRYGCRCRTGMTFLFSSHQDPTTSETSILLRPCDPGIDQDHIVEGMDIGVFGNGAV